MGQEITRTHFSSDDFARFQTRLKAETAELARFAAAGGFADARYFAGFELEATLIDHAGLPRPDNAAFLQALHDPLVVPELSRFNVELNAPPMEMGAGALYAMDASLKATWARCQEVAHARDTILAMIGILPTLRESDLCLANMSALKRFDALNAQVLEQREGRPIRIDIRGRDHLQTERPDVMLEAATTSFQLHLQVPYGLAGPYYNASLLSCAPLVALGGNAPTFLGRRLWQETRVPLFEQSVALGGYGGLADPSIRRVTFGRAYAEESLLRLFDENLEHYPVLLPVQLDAPEARFPHLRLHNGAIWRWVRPLIGFNAEGEAHIRLEQRVLPSGPSVLDMVANAAFYYGLARTLALDEAGVAASQSFDDARHNFYEAARLGLDAPLRGWGHAPISARRLILDQCLPMAQQGLQAFGLAGAEIDHYLGVVEARTRSGRTGARWQLDRLDVVQGDVHRMMLDYLENQRSGAPVHEWVTAC